MSGACRVGKRMGWIQLSGEAFGVNWKPDKVRIMGCSAKQLLRIGRPLLSSVLIGLTGYLTLQTLDLKGAMLAEGSQF